MKEKKNIWVVVGVVVVIVAVIFIFVWQQPPKTASGPTPVFAPQGQLIPGFPKGLILDSAAVINGSYSINYSTSTDQYSAVYNSSSSMATLYADYQSYLPANGWTITGSLTTHASFEAISALQGTSQLQVVISSQGKGSQVTISYVVK